VGTAVVVAGFVVTGGVVVVIGLVAVGLGDVVGLVVPAGGASFRHPSIPVARAMTVKTENRNNHFFFISDLPMKSLSPLN
jgi:hypothetical protein